MKKKIITLALAVVMCLSVMTSVTAADTLNRVASTIPGTDIEYNYVENVTVQIPGTDVTYELTGVYEKVGLVYEEGIPIYRFAFLEEGGKVVVKSEGEYHYGYFCNAEWGAGWGDGVGVNLQINDGCIYPVDTAHSPVNNPTVYIEKLSTNINDDSNCSLQDDAIARVEFYFGYGGKCSNGYEYPYDLISFEYGQYWDTDDECFYYGDIPAEIEKIDIAFLDVNYEEPVEYNIIEGANSVVNSDANVLTIKADGEFSKFTGVKVDGEFVDSSYYTATEGSTIIEFKADYLKTLDAGEHTVSVVFTDGEATTKIEIKENDNNSNNNTTDSTNKDENSDNLVTDVEIPNTDGNTSVAAAFIAMTFSGMALIGLKKKK